MTDGNQSRTAKPESLEAKFKLLALLPYDRRAKRKHSLVFGFILDWYHSKYGDALASVRHITDTVKERDPAGVGLYAGDVHAALTDLVAWGYLEQEKGTGRRASRYMPVWSKLDSVHKIPNTTDDEISVRENANTSVRGNANATGDSVRENANEDPSTPTRSLDQGTGVEETNACAAPTAPPAPPAIAADAAVTAQGGFEELYRAYDVRKNKADARRAYEKLAPDAELHASMVVAAKAWRDAAGETVERMYLARWIREEHFDEDPRRGERKVKSLLSKKDNSDFDATNNNQAPAWIGDISAFVPAGRHETAIKTARMDGDDMVLTFDIERPDITVGDVEHRFATTGDEAMVAKARRFVDQLLAATGMTPGPDLEPSAFEGAEVDAIVGRDGSIRYERAARETEGS